MLYYLVDDDFFVFVDFFLYFVCRVIYIHKMNYCVSVVWKVARKIILSMKFCENYELKFNKKSCIYLYVRGYSWTNFISVFWIYFNSGNNEFMLIFHWIHERTYNIINIKSNSIEVIPSNVKNNLIEIDLD